MKLIVGLGNPGEKYAGNRHNIGFMAIDELARGYGFGPWKKRFQGYAADGQIGLVKCILLKPSTFMNESGRAVGEAIRFYKLPISDVIVVHDEIDLKAGMIRIKKGGGNAGHNGLKSITAHAGNDYVRVRLGVDHPGDKALVSNYVLQDFAKSDREWLFPLLEGVARGMIKLVEGSDAAFLAEAARGRKASAPAAEEKKIERVLFGALNISSQSDLAAKQDNFVARESFPESGLAVTPASVSEQWVSYDLARHANGLLEASEPSAPVDNAPVEQHALSDAPETKDKIEAVSDPFPFTLSEQGPAEDLIPPHASEPVEATQTEPSPEPVLPAVHEAIADAPMESREPVSQPSALIAHHASEPVEAVQTEPSPAALVLPAAHEAIAEAPVVSWEPVSEPSVSVAPHVSEPVEAIQTEPSPEPVLPTAHEAIADAPAESREPVSEPSVLVAHHASEPVEATQTEPSPEPVLPAVHEAIADAPAESREPVSQPTVLVAPHASEQVEATQTEPSPEPVLPAVHEPVANAPVESREPVSEPPVLVAPHASEPVEIVRAEAAKPPLFEPERHVNVPEDGPGTSPLSEPQPDRPVQTAAPKKKDNIFVRWFRKRFRGEN